MNRRTQKAAIAALIGFLMFSSLYLHISRQFLFSDDDHNRSPISIVPLRPQRNLAIQEEMVITTTQRSSTLMSATATPTPTESVLLPDWQVMVISPIFMDTNSHSCRFQNGATSQADFAGMVSGGRVAFICSLPPSVRRLRPFLNPHLVDTAGFYARPPATMARWNRLAYDSFSTPHDVIVFAKGINNRQTASRPASTLRCVFSVHGIAVDVTNVTSSAQEVFRCGHPSNISPADDVRVSVKIVGEDKLATVAVYKIPPASTELDQTPSTRNLLCASTMVYNASKFLPEWVKYHAAVGVEKFILYDNGSEDDLHSTVAQLRDDGGYDLSIVYWPWPKTQEASFSHSAATNRDTCTWMAFIDIDEFVFSPAWSISVKPVSTMLSSMLPIEAPGDIIGQVSINCLEFGPTGQRNHPKSGVTQGYTCRKHAENRHKSILRLDAVDCSLVNSVHHFRLHQERKWETKWFGVGEMVVNHYKFQAWEEFRVKFRRRASSYVADWKESVNPGSKDRTPGLGFDPVEPEWWAQRQSCEVNDTRLRDLTRRWFGRVGPDAKMAWEE